MHEVWDGASQGVEMFLSTLISGADNLEKIQTAAQNLFPGIEFPLRSSEFPCSDDLEIRVEIPDLSTFMATLREARILDTAMDAMSRNLSKNSCWFDISRQAALCGKVAFPVGMGITLGGVFRIELQHESMLNWIENATWHIGRDYVPRNIDDEDGMTSDGESVKWH